MKSFEPNRKYFTISVYILGVILVSALFIKVIFSWDDIGNLLRSFLSALSPFLIGFFIAYLLNPLTKLFHHRILKNIFHIKSKLLRGMLSIIIIYLLVIGLVAVTLIFMLPQIGQSISDLIGRIPTWAQNVITGTNQLMDALKERLPDDAYAYLSKTVNENLPKILDASAITSWLTSALPQMVVTSIGVVKGVFNFLVAIIVSIYMLIDKHTMGNAINRLLHACVSKRRADSMLNTAKECNTIVSRFISGSILDSLIVGVISFTGMSLLGLPYALLISVVVGFTNMIPYFGPWIGGAPGALIIFLISPWKAFIFIVFMLVLQQIDGLFLAPRILGQSTGLRPVWIIFAITFGGSVGGVLGMYLGVPVIAVLAYLIGRWIDKRLEKKAIDRETLELKTAAQPLPEEILSD